MDSSNRKQMQLVFKTVEPGLGRCAPEKLGMPATIVVTFSESLPTLPPTADRL